MSTDVDWDALRARATQAAASAYAPYSGLHVGAAGLTDRGEIVTGCNVENASYGLTLCAECGLVGNLRITATGALSAVVVTEATGAVLMPCGRCRQVLLEVGGPALLVQTPDGPRPMADLLPGAFTRASLPHPAPVDP